MVGSITADRVGSRGATRPPAPPAGGRHGRDQLLVRRRLSDAGVPVVPVLIGMRAGRDRGRLVVGALPDSFVLRPLRADQGPRALVAVRRTADGWETAGGGHVTRAEVRTRVDALLGVTGRRPSAYPPAGALVEPLLRPPAPFDGLTADGLPDVRLFCLAGEPVLATARIPTRASEGRRDVRLGAVAATVDLTTGRLRRARIGATPVERHPDSDQTIEGLVVPLWDQVVGIAERCVQVFAGDARVDVTVDRELGPRCLEVELPGPVAD